MADRDRFFYAWLKDLGIEKGKPFKPTDDQKEILQQAPDVGMAMSQAISFNKTANMFPTSLYGKDFGWDTSAGDHGEPVIASRPETPATQTRAAH